MKAMNHNKQRGFTLIELMVTIAILAVLVAIALPNMSDWVAQRRIANRAEQVANLMRFARAEAARRNVPIIVCPVTIRANSGEPNNQCNNSQQGLTAFQDLNRNNNLDVNEAIRTVVLNQNAAAGNVNMVANRLDFTATATAFANAPRVAFLPNGTFGWYANNNLVTGSGFVRYTLNDTTSDTHAAARRSASVLLDASGRASVCPTQKASNACTAVPTATP